MSRKCIKRKDMFWFLLLFQLSVLLGLRLNSGNRNKEVCFVNLNCIKSKVFYHPNYMYV